ncbi:MAG TPA: Do family serine endopeptidase [Sphingobacteriaceae bacterium]
MKTNSLKLIGLIFFTALLSAALAIGFYRFIDSKNNQVVKEETIPVNFANMPDADRKSLAPDFIQSAATATPAVVHIQTTYSSRRTRNSLEEFFGMPGQSGPARASGSGVIIAQDGYIVTNNHVVENADGIEVILPDKRSFQAKLIGRDPSTDLALIKINGSGFPVLNFGNSDLVQVGEWVLAVGYPLSLNTTVTAGIISAKGRSIGILDRPSPGTPGEDQRGSTAIESFIQTDAAINPGNSGGALVNANGELIGINAAIASQTGGYQGYGFAIPVNLAKKIVSDLRQYGEVRRGFLGVTFPAPAAESELLKEKGIAPGSVSGVYLTGVQPGSPAAMAGLREGDIVQNIDGVKINSSSEFSERIARHRPGDSFPLTFLRNGSTRTVNVTLKSQPAPALAENTRPGSGTAAAKLGASFAPIPDEYKQQYRLRSGVIVTEVQRGGLFSQIGIPAGTVIISINRMAISNINDLNKALAIPNNGMISINGITPDGSRIVVNVPVGA